MPLGIYISVPFCRTKCSYCNFSSGVFSKALFSRYVDRLCADMERVAEIAAEMGGELEREVDSIYLGGGTPTLLEPAQLERIFGSVRNAFQVKPEAETTIECAPGTLTSAMLEALVGCGVNRVSLGVQSFVDREAASVARLHTRQTVMADIKELRAAGIENINLDLIAGLPHQTKSSWEESLQQAIDTGAPHISVYMLEVDEDSRLGREVMAGGTRYHAHSVPDDDLTADLYLRGCERLESAGISQYEISNFARPGYASRHNLKYWTRQPYLGFGVDAHSMLPAPVGSELEAVRFSMPDSLEHYTSGAALTRTAVSWTAALEEAFFLGLRLCAGIDFTELAERYGTAATAVFRDEIAELCRQNLLELTDGRLRLTVQGRLLSNEVFARFISISAGADSRS